MKIFLDGKELKSALEVARRFTEPDIDRLRAIHVEPGPNDKTVRLMASNGMAVVVAEVDAEMRREGFEQLTFDEKVMKPAHLSSLSYPDLNKLVADAEGNENSLRAWVHADLFCAAVKAMATIGGEFSWLGLRLDRRSLALLVYRNDREGPFFSARMPLLPRPDGEEYPDDAACSTIKHEYLVKALPGLEDAEHLEISIPKERAPMMVKSGAMTVVVMPAGVEPDYWKEAIMRVTELSYRNKVKYGEGCEEEMTATVQLDPGDDPGEAAALARRTVKDSLVASESEREDKLLEEQGLIDLEAEQAEIEQGAELDGIPDEIPAPAEESEHIPF